MASVSVTRYYLDIYKWYFYLMITVSDKNENFRIYLTTVFIETRNKKVEKIGGGSQDFEISRKGFVGSKSLGTTVLGECWQYLNTGHDSFFHVFHKSSYHFNIEDK
jgi:hypothetical protein